MVLRDTLFSLIGRGINFLQRQKWNQSTHDLAGVCAVPVLLWQTLVFSVLRSLAIVTIFGMDESSLISRMRR